MKLPEDIKVCVKTIVRRVRPDCVLWDRALPGTTRKDGVRKFDTARMACGKSKEDLSVQS